jgi:four helix bundle protein
MLKLPFQKLVIWQKAMQLASGIFVATKLFPESESFGLTSQIRRAGNSVPSNIAEGSQRGSNKDFAKFILVAKGSLAEVQTQLILAHNFGYLTEKKLDPLLQSADELSRMLFAFHKKLTTAH